MQNYDGSFSLSFSGANVRIFFILQINGGFFNDYFSAHAGATELIAPRQGFGLPPSFPRRALPYAIACGAFSP